MVTHISKSPEETFQLAFDFGAKAEPGLVIGLIGDLGAGKTHFVKGFAAGLGVSERIHSPTFTLVNEYLSGRVHCFHLDLYRLETVEQIIAAGLEQYFNPKHAITLVEWFDRARGNIPVDGRHTIIRFESTGENERKLTYEDSRA